MKKDKEPFQLRLFGVVKQEDKLAYDYEIVAEDRFKDYVYHEGGEMYVTVLNLPLTGVDKFYTAFIDEMNGDGADYEWPFCGMLRASVDIDELRYGHMLVWLGTGYTWSGYDVEDYNEMIEKGLDPVKELTPFKRSF